MKYVELFAGAGGLSRGLDAAGFHCAAHAEIEPHARAVLRHHWPDVPLFGDVTQLDGAQFHGITLLSGGSPCQDLSVAGKRAGMTEGSGTRSSLFYEQVRLWNESEAPYLLWENVYGALSSNSGRDFAAVLSALVGAAIAVPADGWNTGGVAAGRTAVAAWRVSDLQHFGPPQRRVRVFVLAARAGGVDPAEVLALAESVCGHPAPREQAREAATGTLSARTKGGGGLGTDFDLDGGVVAMDAVCDTLGVGANQTTGFASPNVLAFSLMPQNSGKDYTGREVDVLQTLHTGGTSPAGNQGGDVVLAFHHTQDPISGDVAPAIGRKTDGMGVMAFSENQRGEVLTSDVMRQLTTGGGKPGQGYPAICTTGDTTHALTHEGADASEDGTGRGTPIVVFGNVGMESWKRTDVAVTLSARDGKGGMTLALGANNEATPVSSARAAAEDVRPLWADTGAQAVRDAPGRPERVHAPEVLRPSMHGSGVRREAGEGEPVVDDSALPRAEDVPTGAMLEVQEGRTHGRASHQRELAGQPTGESHAALPVVSHQAAQTVGRPRRLMPIETERLMSWPDHWTAHGVKEDGMCYALSDTARYRLCGNGVASVQVEWIARRLADAITAQGCA